MNKAAITICIPFYSNTEYLRVAIQSVIAQTRTDWLCIISDDAGPCPDSENLVSEFNDSRLKYVRAEKNGGLAVNWNRCLDMAETDLVMLLHADDELKPTYLETMLSLTDQNNAAAGYFCNAEIIDQNGRICFSFPDWVKHWIRPHSKSPLNVQGDDGLASLMRGNYIMCPTMVYRKSKIKNLRFSTAWKMVLDLEMYAEILKSGGQLVGSPETEYRYRRHPDNQTSKLTTNTIRFDEEISLYNNIAKQAAARGWLRTAATSERKTIIKLNLLFQVAISIFRLQPSTAQKFLRVLFERFVFKL